MTAYFIRLCAAPCAAICVVLLVSCAAPSKLTPARTSSATRSGETNRAITADDSARQRFLAAALRMLGQPYRFGGSAPGGFDCSGLVSFAASEAGLLVPRTAREQLLAGREVVREQILPGDLVFMRLGSKLHVGIASNTAQFVHAPSSGGKVRIDRLDAAPFDQAFLVARRLRGQAESRLGNIPNRHGLQFSR